MATPAAPTISAVADAASAARVLSHVQLAGSCSATVHARCLVAPVALSAGQGYLVAYKRRCLAQPSAGGLSSVLVTPPTTVLLGSFVGGTVRASVSRRARGSASQGRGIVAPALLFALIHPSDAPMVKRRCSRRRCGPRLAARWARNGRRKRSAGGRPPWLRSALGSG